MADLEGLCTCEFGSRLGDGRTDTNRCPVHDMTREELLMVAAYDREEIEALEERLEAGFIFVADGALISLENCPIGLFVSEGEVCLKTEYIRGDGAVDAYIVSSGEAFWGPQPQTVEHQRSCMVQPLAATRAEEKDDE